MSDQLIGIADELAISVKTVNRHKANVMEKLAIRSSSELMHFAIREKLVEIPPHVI